MEEVSTATGRLPIGLFALGAVALRLELSGQLFFALGSGLTPALLDADRLSGALLGGHFSLEHRFALGPAHRLAAVSGVGHRLGGRAFPGLFGVGFALCPGDPGRAARFRDGSGLPASVLGSPGLTGTAPLAAPPRFSPPIVAAGTAPLRGAALCDGVVARPIRTLPRRAGPVALPILGGAGPRRGAVGPLGAVRGAVVATPAADRDRGDEEERERSDAETVSPSLVHVHPM